MWPDRTIDYVKITNDKDGDHFGLFVHNKLVSIISIFIEEDHAQFRKFATVVEDQGKGYGTKLLSYVLNELEKNQLTKIWCNARKEKAFYYERFGMIKTDVTFAKGGIDYVIMKKIINYGGVV